MWSPGCPSPAIKRQERTETTLAAACIAVAASVGWLLPLTFVSSLLFTIAAALIVALTCRRAGWIGAKYRIVEARMSGDGAWSLMDGSGNRFSAVLTPRACVMSHLIWLHWRCEGGGRQLVLVRNPHLAPTQELACALDEWRRLIVALRWVTPQSARTLNRDALLPGADGT